MFDAARLLSRATAAFIDRAAIDWEALLTRARSGADRAMVRNLQFLHSIRPIHSSSINMARGGVQRAIWWVLIASMLQTACAVSILGSALANGEALGDRADQAVIMSAFCAASMLLLATSRDPRILALLAWFATVASLFGRSAVHGLPEAWFSPIDFLFRGVSLEAFAPACVWCFATVFPRVERFTHLDVVTARAATASWLIGMVLFVVNFTSTYVPIDSSPIAYLVRTRPGNTYWEILTLALMPAVGAVLARAQRAPAIERRKVRRFAIAIAGGTAPILLLGILLTLRPAVGQWTIDAYPAEDLLVHRIMIGGLAATPLVASLAIVVDRPFELHAFLRLRAVLALARVLLGGAPILVVIALLCQTVYQHRDLTIEQLFSSPSGAPLLLYAAAACGLFLTRARLLDAFDRFVSRRAAEHQTQLTRALERVRLARGAREVVAVLESELRRGTGADAVAVLRPDESGEFAASSPRTSPLSPDTALVAILHDTDGPVDVSEDGPLLALLPQRDREWVAANDVSLIAAVKHRDETMAAVIAIGSKRGGVMFDERDRWLISTVAAAAATWHEGSSAGAQDASASVGRDANDAAIECPRCGLVSDTHPLGCTCGEPPVPAALPHLLADEFLVERRLGAGGMGVVYRARDVRLDRDVALKTLPALKHGSIARLRDEARAMAALNYESLATIFDFHVWRRTPVLVVEYLPNGTLAHRLTNGPFAADETLMLGIALARALVYMHAQGALHRDLKPSNIGFSAAGVPKLLDFGLTVLTDPAAIVDPNANTESSQAVRAGTPAYLPPEAFHGAAPTAAFDLWALSLILLEALTGVNPFADGNRSPAIHRSVGRVIAGATPDTQAWSPAMRAFFERALNHEPSRRFATAAELLRALETLPR